MNKIILWMVAVAALALSIAGLVIGNNQVLGNSRFPNGLQVGNGSNATTTIVTGKLCLKTFTSADGTNPLYYFPATSTGNAASSGWATSTTACN